MNSATSIEPLVAELSTLKRGLRDAIAKDPIDSLVVTVLGGSFLFFVAEKGKNPKVNTYWDALVFISTCLSVGYADTFARTPAGKAIATALMTIGPAMAAAALAPPKSEQTPDLTPELLEVQRAIVDKLDAILAELRAGRAGATEVSA